MWFVLASHSGEARAASTAGQDKNHQKQRIRHDRSFSRSRRTFIFFGFLAVGAKRSTKVQTSPNLPHMRCFEKPTRRTASDVSNGSEGLPNRGCVTAGRAKCHAQAILTGCTWPLPSAGRNWLLGLVCGWRPPYRQPLGPQRPGLARVQGLGGSLCLHPKP